MTQAYKPCQVRSSWKEVLVSPNCRKELAFCQTYLVRHYFAFDIMQPDAFPPELWLESFSYLEHQDHKALTKTCSLFADLARTYIFSILTFDGNKQGLTVRRDGRGLNRTIGRTKTIEWAHLPKAVDKLCDLAIPRFVKTFKFNPAFYVSGKVPIVILSYQDRHGL